MAQADRTEGVRLITDYGVEEYIEKCRKDCKYNPCGCKNPKKQPSNKGFWVSIINKTKYHSYNGRSHSDF